MTQSCPPRDVLIDAAAPGSDPALRERIADHLITCAACADDFRLLQAIAPWASEHAHLLAPEGRAIAAGPALAARRAWWLPPGYAVAAVLALVAVALTVQNRRLDSENRAAAARAAAPALPDPRIAEQQRTIADLEQRLRAADMPDLNAPIVDLEASGNSRTAAAIPAPPVRPAGPASEAARRVVFVLNAARRNPGAVYDVDIVDPADRVVWTGTGLSQSADGTLTLAMPHSLAAPGSRIRLYSRAGAARGASNGRALVEQYVVPASR